MNMFLLAILIMVAFFCVIKRKDPQNFIEIKQRYATLRAYIANNKVPEKFKVLTKQILLIGYTYKKHELGYNTNKGYEIGLCLDGSPNQVFHVLLHELAHSTVSEYEHSEHFWKNFKELRELATSIGIYEPVMSSEKFCGKYISDS